MKKTIALVLFTVLIAPAAYADERNLEIPHHHQGTEPKPDDYHSPAAPPPKGAEVRKYAIDEPGPTAKNFGMPFVNDNEIFWQVLGDRLEYRTNDDNDILLWDGDAWIGGDYNKLYLESEGEYNFREDDIETASTELFWNRAIRPFWDTQLGIRHDFISDEDDRSFLAAGIQGMAPYVFEVDATGYVSDEGDVSAVLEVERSWYFTQRLAIQPRFETELAVQDVEEYNIGSGITGFETGLRARYEVSRKFAPYIGVSWEQNVGETADLIEEDGGDTSNTYFLTGVKFWF
jgi:copper resistance protein B